MSRANTSGSTQTYAAGQQNNNFNTFFDVHSTSLHSHIFPVDNDFFRITAYNLSGSETVTLEQVTNPGQPNQLIAPYAPVSGPVTLTTARTSYIVERPGHYRLTLSGGGLGTVVVVGFQFAMENEASQDIADALYAILNQAFDPCKAGAAIPTDSTANNNVISKSSGCLVDQQLVSDGVGNLIQLRDDGLYYGILPPPNFANQYVSSSTGNDANPGTQIAPLQTIQKAISNLPDGTMGNIFLKAGDTFHSYPTAVADLVSTLTLQQTIIASQTLDIGNRSLVIVPYNDTAIDAIELYNTTYNTLFDPYRAAETNFPIIVINISHTTDTAQYIPIHYKVGVNGSLSFSACNFRMGNLGATSITALNSAVTGFGTFQLHGGNLILGSGSIIGESTQSGNQVTTLSHVIVQDGAGPPASEFFCFTGTYYTVNTLPAIAPGGVLVPAGSGGGPGLAYTENGDNTEAFLATAALWSGITIYSTAFRSFRHVFTSIPIA